MHLGLSRRELLRRAGLAAAALGISDLRADPPAAQPESQPSPAAPPAPPAPMVRKGPAKKILILGAGMAGLGAGYELSRAGHDVTILEARPHAGGRVHTLRESFADGLHVDTGASSLPSSHRRVFRYIEELGLAVDLWLEPRLAKLTSFYHVDGQRIVPGPGVEQPFALTPEERKAGSMALLEKYYLPGESAIGDPLAPDWPTAAARKIDELSMADFLRSHGASEGAVKVLGLRFYLDLPADGIEEVSALWVLRDGLLSPGTDTIHKIRGGMDQLPRALAAKLKEKVLYGCPVERIQHSPAGVEVAFQQGGVAQKLSAEYLLCTLPFSTLRDVEITPGFSPEKQKVIREMPYCSTVRTFLQTRRRYWIDGGFSGFACTDLPIKFVFDSTSDASSGRGMLESYASGPNGRIIEGLPPEERVDFVLREMEKVHPGLRAQVEGGECKNWMGERWSRGAYAYYRPGQFTSLYPHAAKAEGRVHFAGEHVSPYPHWMEGALFAAERAAREINDA